jgi:diguanylate cyclase (GGDEF)-like protein
MVGFALTLLGIVSIGGYRQLQVEREYLARESAMEASNLALAFEQNVLRIAKDLDRILVYLRRSFERDQRRTSWQALISEDFTVNDQSVQIAVIDARGQMITSTAMLYPERPIDLSDREHFKFHASGKLDVLFISKPMIGRASGRSSVQFARRLTNDAGDFAGVVVISLDPNQLARTYERIDLGGGGLALVGRDGIVRTGTGRFRSMLGRGLREGRYLETLPQISDTHLSTQLFDGARKIVASRQVKDLPLEVLVVLDAPEDGKLWKDRARIQHVAIVLLSTLVIGVLLAALYSQRHHELSLIRVARRDALTGLPNRVGFQESLDVAFANTAAGQPIALHLIDLDGFKAVNDTHGHPIGDALLKTVGQRLRDIRRAGDAIARLGGDEFAIIQVGAGTPEQAAALAKRVCDALRAPYQIDGISLAIGASIGTAIAPCDADTPDELNIAADLALYTAKTEGRSTFRHFDPSMSELVRQRRQVEVDLERALANEEFQLHYQPIVGLEESRVIGYEALVRWDHPVRGQVPPGEFISVAEESGQIERLGLWVIRHACEQLARWPDHYRVAVNCSPLQLKSGSLAASVETILRNCGIAPDRLEIEITESTLMSRDTVTVQQLEALGAIGIRIAMDDFGTGYSSLSYLQSYPITCIKIDRSFVQKLGTSSSANSIVRAIISLAQALGMRTVAEGVETEGQLKELVQLGCKEAQGFLLGRPLPAARMDLHESPAPTGVMSDAA